ncbi:uncharacterized protein LOC122402146 [Colletes gigas]|uniref:uncharacterized protein LOC122402146 n=1 Tax=Colletes gigas TaxID=935657 RepID=UPI001C9A7D99|nr:uncharacterized protein LOC122402146 [Colletes gigas]
MPTVFFDYRGVVHSELLPDGQTVNKEYYFSVMRRLRENIRRKRPDVWKNNCWILHHDNASSHTSILVREFLAKNSTNVIEQAPYSSDMALCDFFLFPKLKLPLRGRRFESMEAIKENSQKELKALPSPAFKKCFEDWEKRWRMCIASDGAYFEGDKINLDDQVSNLSFIYKYRVLILHNVYIIKRKKESISSARGKAREARRDPSSFHRNSSERWLAQADFLRERYKGVLPGNGFINLANGKRYALSIRPAARKGLRRGKRRQKPPPSRTETSTMKYQDSVLALRSRPRESRRFDFSGFYYPASNRTVEPREPCNPIPWNKTLGAIAQRYR